MDLPNANRDGACSGKGLVGELELQARWFAGEFGRDFEGTSGERVRVVQFGIWNRTAGPDFVEAAVCINDGEVRRGAIELDPDVRDWERHGHSQNANYEEVVLHVFFTSGTVRVFSRTVSHRLVVQVQLGVQEKQGSLDGAVARAGRCAPVLGGMTAEEVRAVLQEAAHFRFQRKASALARTGEAHGESEALYQAVATGLGYPGNQLAFRLLAQRLSFARLAQQPEDAEALLFGVAGFLPGPDLSALAPAARHHARHLWARWWTHRASHQALVVPRAVWRMSGQRPANHPARRVGALSVLVRHWRTVRRFVTGHEWERLSRVLGGMVHPFWSLHYTFGAAAARSMALIGDERVVELFINAVFPFTGAWESLLKLRAPERNRRSRIAAARLLAHRTDARALLKDAVNQQGLLQLYEDYCCRDASDCVACPFPEQTKVRPHDVG